MEEPSHRLKLAELQKMTTPFWRSPFEKWRLLGLDTCLSHCKTNNNYGEVRLYQESLPVMEGSPDKHHNGHYGDGEDPHMAVMGVG